MRVFNYIKDCLAAIGIAVLFDIALVFSFKDMRTHFVSLLVRSWYAMMGVSSSSTFGFLAWLIAFAFAGWLAGVLVERHKLAGNGEREPFKKAFLGSGRLGIYTAILFGLVIIAGVCGFMVRTVFYDHQYFAAKISELSQVKQELATAKTKLLATPYRGDRHFSSEQENALYLALRDVIQTTPVNLRRIYMGVVEGDKESQRLRDLFLLPNFERAGWKVSLFVRHVARKDGDVRFPEFGYPEDISVTATLDLVTPEYKKELEQINGLLMALKILEPANILSAQGLMDPHEPLRGAHGFIVWISPKKDGPK